jgi:hypothetical protein
MIRKQMLQLIKLCVGVRDAAELRHWQAERLEALRSAGETPELVHITRQTPRQRSKLLNGGSLYWVIGGMVTVQQRLVDIRPHAAEDGTPKCALVLGAELIEVAPRPRRPFQGWRYLKPEEAPPGLTQSGSASSIPPGMREELAALGLL